MLLGDLPVTAVHYTNADRTLLAGRGPWVLVFNKSHVDDKMYLVHNTSVLPGSEKVHGFSDVPVMNCQGIVTVVWSTESIYLFDAKAGTGSLLLSGLPDIVHSAEWLPGRDLLIVALGHNQLEVYQVDLTNDDHPRASKHSKFRCVETELTWTTLIVPRAACETEIVAGTSSGKLIMWSALIEDETCRKQKIIDPQQIVQGHKGPIFKLSISTDGRHLVSAGDDWSIRVWRKNSQEQWHQIASVFGHEGRIWNCKFLPSLNASQLSLGTSSEDRTCRTWTCEEENLKICRKFSGHLGKSVRALSATATSVAGNRRIVSGGDDGGLLVHDIDNSECTELFEFPRTALHGNQIESIRALIFVSRSQLLATTDGGRLLRISPSDTGPSQFKTLWTSDKAFAFAQNSLAPCGSKAVIAGDSQSCLSLFTEITRSTGISMKRWKAVDTGMALVISCPTDTEALVSSSSGRVFHWDWTDDLTLNGVYETPFKQPALAIAGCRDAGFVAFCDKVGRILVFRYAKSFTEGDIPPVHSIRPHQDRITHIRLGKTCPNSPTRLYTGDCNGVYVSTVLKDEADKVSLVFESSRKRNGELEHIGSSVEVNDRTLLFGFAASRLLVWDQTNSRQLATADCGGWRRPHCSAAFSSDCFGEIALFASFRKSTVQITSVPIPRHETLITKLHGMRINCCQVMETAESRNGALVVVTGAEDTNVVVSVFDAIQSSVGKRFTLEGHEAGVAALVITKSLSRPVIFSGAGQGELRAWSESTGGVWGLRRKSRPKFRKYQSQTKAIARCTSLALLEEKGDIWVVFGSSLGEIGFHKYDDTTDCVDFEVHQRRIVHQGLVRCLQVVDDRYVVSGDSLGIIVVQTAHEIRSAGITVASSITCHQMAVNCMFCWVDSASKYLWILSGGDDESVALSMIAVDPHGKGETVGRVHSHCAAVAGVWVGPRHGSDSWSDNLYAISVGLDQKLCLYSLSTSGLRLCHTELIDVPDAGALTVAESGRGREAFIVGAGMQRLSVEALFERAKL